MPRHILIGLLLLAFAGSETAQAQFGAKAQYHSGLSGTMPEAGFSLGTHGTTAYYLRGDSLVAFDFLTSVRTMLPIDDPFMGFAGDTTPSATSSSVSVDGGAAWVWDGSVGTTVRIDTKTGESTRWDLYSSRSQYKHAGGLNPISGRPMAFSGYGYYRAKDFLVEFVDSLATWRELSIGGPRPEPRMHAVMISGWHPTKIAIVGGDGVIAESLPPNYARPLSEVWVLDLTSKRWTLIGSDEQITCMTANLKDVLGHVPVDPASGSVLLLTQDACRAQEYASGAVYRWNPESTELELVGMGPSTRPDQGRLAGLFVSPDTRTVSVVHVVPDEGPMESWLTIRSEVGPLDVADTSSSSPLGLRWILWLALAGGLIFGGRVVYRRAMGSWPVTVQFSGSNGDVSLQVAGENRSSVISQHAHLLLAHLAERPTRRGDRITSDELQTLFETHYSDSDSARVIRNRAIEELNRLLTHNGASDALERVRRKDDARRYDYIAREGFELS